MAGKHAPLELPKNTGPPPRIVPPKKRQVCWPEKQDQSFNEIMQEKRPSDHANTTWILPPKKRKMNQNGRRNTNHEELDKGTMAVFEKTSNLKPSDCLPPPNLSVYFSAEKKKFMLGTTSPSNFIDRGALKAYTKACSVINELSESKLEDIPFEEYHYESMFTRATKEGRNLTADEQKLAQKRARKMLRQQWKAQPDTNGREEDIELLENIFEKFRHFGSDGCRHSKYKHRQEQQQ